MMLDAMLFASFMSMMMPPPVLIVTPMGAPLGHVSDIQAEPDLASDARVEAEDHGHDQGQTATAPTRRSADDGGADASDDRAAGTTAGKTAAGTAATAAPGSE